MTVDSRKTLRRLLHLLLLLALTFAASAQESAQADAVVLRVGTNEVRTSEVGWRFGVAMRGYLAQLGLPYTPEVAEQLLPTLGAEYLEQLGQEMALVGEARRRGLEADEEGIDAEIASFKAELEGEDEFKLLLNEAGFPGEAELKLMLVEADLVRKLDAQLFEEADASLTDPMVRSRYLASREQYREPATYCARHILVEEEELALELLERYEDGEAFAKLAAQYGTDGTRNTGGDLGCFQQGMMVQEFQDAVEAASLRQAEGPVETQFGYHLVLVYDRTEARLPTFDEVEGSVRYDAASLATDAAISGILSAASITTYPENLQLP